LEEEYGNWWERQGDILSEVEEFFMEVRAKSHSGK